MPCENNDGIKSSFDEAMVCLSSLITRRTRADNNNTGDAFYLLYDYLKILELEEPIRQLKVIHVAGTKGKGSTCAFTESILRNCGLRTGLFTSPHLIDVRERFQLDGMDICKEKFLTYFWWCWDRLKEKTSDEIPMPSYFRFLTLLAFKIFAAEQVDVAILEVGLGGKFDATNVVKSPVVCGIASLGYDHMEILGNTLAQIAGEKAGIFKHGVPAFTVPQPDEAMHVLVEKASKLDVHLKVAAPLDPSLLNGLHLGLEGEHQYVNAGLAFALCSTWLQRTGHAKINYLEENALPDQFIKGLTTAGLRGRGQVVSDEVIETERQEDLVFYLDGAHSPESMDVCANWFCRILKEDYKHISPTANNHEHNQSRTLYESVRKNHNYTLQKKTEQILLFNCMSVRDPNLLLPHLTSTCARHGVYFQKALFVPSISVYNKVGKSVDPPKDAHVDISWQLTLQRVWENLRSGKPDDRLAIEILNLSIIFHALFSGISGWKSDKKKKLDAGKHAKGLGEKGEGTVINSEKGIRNFENSSVFPSLPLALNFLRDTVRGNQSTRFRVLVTGSLHLVGDVLRLVKK